MRYIAIEGPIGVGKTTLTKLLAENLNVVPILETFENNPFLENFYQKKEEAFSTMAFFLMERFDQLKEINHRLLKSEFVVADYLFNKSLLFAQLDLTDEEFHLFKRLHQPLSNQVTQPDLLVYLKASPYVIMNRIKSRGRNFEEVITIERTRKLLSVYDDFYYSFPNEKIMLDTSSYDVVNSLSDRLQILNSIVTYCAKPPIPQVDRFKQFTFS